MGAKNASSKANNSRALQGLSWQREVSLITLCARCPAKAALDEGTYLWLPSWALPLALVLASLHPSRSACFTSPSAAPRGTEHFCLSQQQTRHAGSKLLSLMLASIFHKDFSCFVLLPQSLSFRGGHFFLPSEPGSWDSPTLTHWTCPLVNNYCCNQKSALTAQFPQSHGTLPSTGLTDSNIVTVCLPLRWWWRVISCSISIVLNIQGNPKSPGNEKHFTRSPSRCFEESADVLLTAVRMACGRVRSSATQTQLKFSLFSAEDFVYNARSNFPRVCS